MHIIRKPRERSREKRREKEVILASCLMVSRGSEAWIKSLPSQILLVRSLECLIFRILVFLRALISRDFIKSCKENPMSDDDDDFTMYLNYLPMKMIVEPCYAFPSVDLRLT